MHFSATAYNKVILTAISTTPARERTRSVSKKVKRFLLVGRVVRKKLTRATQQKLEAVKESRQRSNFTAAAIFFGPIFVFNQGTELVFAGFLTVVILQFVLTRALNSDFLILLFLSHVFSLMLFDQQWTIQPQLWDSLWLVILLSREHLFQWRREV